jgi:hypothetical protein
MDPTKRTSWKIWTIGAATLAVLFFASSATANDRQHRHRGEQINNHLDLLAAFAALSGDPDLAAALDHKGDLIEHYVDRHDRHGDHESDHWRKRARKHHRHFDGCGHGFIGHGSKHGRHSWRNSHHGRHEVRRHNRLHKRNHKRHRNSNHRRHLRD